MLDKIIGVEEAAKILGLSPGTIKNKCAAGEIPAKKIGKTWILNEEEVKMRVSEPLIWELSMKFERMLMDGNNKLRDEYEKMIDYVYTNTKNELGEEIADKVRYRLLNFVETFQKTGVWDFTGGYKR